MKWSPWIFGALATTSSWSVVCALHEEDAGVFDFVVATAGHGATKYVHASTDGNSVVTSDSPMDGGLLDAFGETSCTVASRDTSTGSLLWRRDVCSSRSSTKAQQHVVAANEEFVYTMDHVGVLRAWTMDKGELVWDAPPPAEGAIDQLQLWAASTLLASAVDRKTLALRDSKSGNLLSTLSASDTLKQAQVSGSGQAMWLHVMPHSNDANAVQALVGWVSTDKKTGQLTGAAGSMALVDIRTEQDGLSQSSKALPKSDNALRLSSLKIQRVQDEWHVMAPSKDSRSLIQFSLSSGFSDSVKVSDLQSSWTAIKAISSTLGSGMVGLQGEDSTSTSLFQYESGNGWKQVYGDDSLFEAVAYCPSMELAVALKRDQGLSVIPWSSAGEVNVVGDSSLVVSDTVTSLTVLSCESNAMTALLSTTLGTTMQLSWTLTAEGASSEIVWTADEGLSQVSAALLLDASHSSSISDPLASDDNTETLARLDASSRLKSQWASLTSFRGIGSGAAKDRDYSFGLIKVAVLLSKGSHRLWGMDTFGSRRGKVRWTLDLPPTASWHSIIHGTSSGSSAVHGANGGVHSREVLVLSSVGDNVEWTCIDGTSGAVHSTASVEAPSAVRQVMPFHPTSSHGSTSCRQMALLLHADNSVSVVPDDEAGAAAALAHLSQASDKNGLYAHVLNHDQDAAIESLQIVSPEDSASMATRLVGQTSFPGERVVGIAYPHRDEVVQSPSQVLGDDSLLLKYLNPHLAAIVTMSDSPTTEDNGDDFSAAFSKVSGSGPKRKPMGVTQPGEGTPSSSDSTDDAPNLFVNVVDTVSGRVLYRASHANVAPSDRMPVLITENWIIYAFFNGSTRRTELGVLSLYEGMIDKKGLTAFSSPEQALSFSSMDALESKPVVLAKTYGIAKTVTALGVTNTRGGISARHVLLASGDDKIMAVDRRILEPRRPTGEVKEHEKNEGLKRYSPLIPLISLWCPSYNQTVQSVSDIISTSAALESQSLILAFGGPDIFFTRTSPSKGFDLLPDSFNRSLLSGVVLGLFCVLLVARMKSSRKTVKIGWS